MVYHKIDKKPDLSLESIVASIRKSLCSEGFGILTEIYIRERIRGSLRDDLRKYRIIGYSNPKDAHRLSRDRGCSGYVFPCNITVCDDEGRTVLFASGPAVTADFDDKAALAMIAASAEDKLLEVFTAIK